MEPQLSLLDVFCLVGISFFFFKFEGFQVRSLQFTTVPTTPLLNTQQFQLLPSLEDIYDPNYSSMAGIGEVCSYFFLGF